ncbi:cytochrome p450 domain-containing protein [Apiospora phragmitis]|uniref:Cytochrome p450 domain-containing protein n=1 Tax=Apiospora phragmitis TaxID=2905665 RepID=A0ABR1TNK0_9PEZI
MDTQPAKAATRLYFTTATATAATAAAFIIDVVHLRPGPLSSKQIWFGLLLALAALYTHVFLRAEYQYYRNMAKHGCAPPNRVRHDPAGIRYLLSTASAAKQHVLLQRRAQLLDAMGHTFRHQIFPEWTMTVSTDEPENIKAVLATRFGDWDIPHYRVQGFHPVLGFHSIFTVNGAEWQHARAMLRPAFVRNQLADLERFDLHARKLLAKLPQQDASAKVDLQNLFSMLMVDTTSDFMFGQSTDLLGAADADSLTFVKYFDASMHKIAWRARLGWLTQLRPDQELNEYVLFMRAYIARFVAQVKEQRKVTAASTSSEAAATTEEGRYVFLDQLIDTGEPDEVIRDQLLSIFVAGRDTTTSVLTYLFLELSRRPDVVRKLRAEIGALDVEDPSWEQLKGMTYLQMAIKEALRLNPPVALNAREAVRDTVLPRGGGPDGREPVFVPKGTNVRYQPWCMQRRKDLYGEDAEEFRPERWETIRPTYDYVPFNAGPRICIGQQFAVTAIAMTTFRILQAYQQIERRDDKPPVQKLGINLSMLHGCWVSLTSA